MNSQNKPTTAICKFQRNESGDRIMRSDKRLTPSLLFALVCAGTVALGGAGLATADTRAEADHVLDKNRSENSDATVKHKSSMGDDGMTSYSHSHVHTHTLSGVKDKPGMGDESMAEHNMSAEHARPKKEQGK